MKRTSWVCGALLATLMTVAVGGTLAVGEAPAPDPAYKVVTPPANYPPELVKALKDVIVPPPPVGPAPADLKLEMVTSRGTIHLSLDGKAAPLHVRSWQHLVGLKFYDGTRFHRRADLCEGGDASCYIVQGGDPFSKTKDLAAYVGMGGPGYAIPREHNKLRHQKMVIAAARSADPNSAGSQFYFTQEATPFLDEGDGYTVFGKVTDGADVVASLRQGDELKSVRVVTPPDPSSPQKS